jgi:hypothetical protein
MDTVAFGGIFAFTGIDIYTKEATVMLRPALTSEDGAVFLQTAMAHRVTGRVAVLQTDGGPEFKGSFAQQARAYCDRHRIARPYKKNEQAYIESFNRTLRKECLGWGTYRVEDLPPLDSGGAHVSRPVSLPPAALGIGAHATFAHRAISPGGPTVGYLRRIMRDLDKFSTEICAVGQHHIAHGAPVANLQICCLRTLNATSILILVVM